MLSSTQQAAHTDGDDGYAPPTGIENEKSTMSDNQIEDIDLDSSNLRYEDAEHEPELHFRTWIALGGMWIYNLAIVFALNSPAAVVR